MIVHRFRAIARFVCAAGLAVVLCAGPITAADPFEIPALVPLTGPAAFAGRDIQTGLLAVQAYINRTGGIRGRPVKFTIQDDQTSPQIAVQLVNGLIAKGVPALIGPAVLGECRAVEPLVQKNGPFSYCYSPGLHPPPGSFMYSCQISTFDLMRVTVNYFRSRGWDRFGFISTTDASGQDGEQQLDEVLALPENRSMSMPVREHYNGADIAVGAQVARLKAAGLKALVVWVTGTPSATAFRGLAEAGVDLPVMSTTANAIPAQLKQYEAFLPKEFIIPGIGSMVPNEVRDRGQRSQIDTYFKEVAALGETPSYNTIEGWDPGLLLATAYRSVGLNATADQIRAYLANATGISGVNGTYNFRAFPGRGSGSTTCIWFAGVPPSEAGSLSAAAAARPSHQSDALGRTSPDYAVTTRTNMWSPKCTTASGHSTTDQTR